MFIKRQLAVIVMTTMGFLALSGYFINWETLRDFTDKDATNFYMIIAGFAAFLGCLNLLQLHLQKISYKKDNWQYSIFTLLGFLIMIYFGFMHKGLDGDPYTDLNGDGKWNDAELFSDLNSNNKWDKGEPFKDLGDGKWNEGESFQDLGNGKWDKDEPFKDLNDDGKWNNAEPFEDLGDNKWNKGESFQDLGNGRWNDAEPYENKFGNYEYDKGEKFIDANNDGKWNKPEHFEDVDTVYTPPIKWGSHLKNKHSAFYWMYEYFYLPLGATMFALLAFFVASASYRAFRIRNFEATLLLISGVLLMLGRVPIGALIPWWTVVFIYTSILFAIIAHMIKDKKIFFISYLSTNILILLILYTSGWYNTLFLSIPAIQEWIMSVPAAAGARAIMIGIALGIIAQSFRIITGRERSILGD